MIVRYGTEYFGEMLRDWLWDTIVGNVDGVVNDGNPSLNGVIEKVPSRGII